MRIVDLHKRKLYQNVEAPAPSYEYLLDAYPGAYLAYSFRELSSTYTGACVRIRRGSDNVEQDFGFVDNYLDTSAVFTFLGASIGFIVKIYDQTGNLKHWINATAATQPKIALSKIGAFASIFADTSQSTLSADTASLFGVTVADYGVVNIPTTNTFFSYGNSESTSTFYLFGRSGNTSAIDANTGYPKYYFNGVLKEGLNRGSVYTELTGTLMKLISITDLKPEEYDRLTLDYEGSSSVSPPTNTFERVLYPDASNRVAIQNNINAYYEIY